ncbi:MAG: hypothetical protein H7281_15640 [Bacteriovorax sp.]|nr:hypothetical protein [Bacteriovorax sp.]
MNSKISFFILSFLLLSGCRFFDSQNEIVQTLQVDCKLYDQESNIIAQFPGFTCAFAPNGEWLSLVESELTLYNKDNSPKYKFPFKAHHELKFSSDGKKIYFLTSDIKMFKGKKTRFDIINISDRNGRILSRWSTHDHLDELYQLFDLKKYDHWMPSKMQSAHFAADEQHEFSHLNAIYEIPQNLLEDTFPFMKHGNLIVTFNGLGSVVIFDPELKRIEHVFEKMIKTELYGFHDAQILPNGHLIFFKNFNEKAGELVTSIEEFDIKKEISVWSFVFNKPDFKHNDINGSVQVLENDNILLGENSFGGRAVEISRSGEIQWLKINDTRYGADKLPAMIYRAKKLNLDEFFKNNILGAWARGPNGKVYAK